MTNDPSTTPPDGTAPEQIHIPATEAQLHERFMQTVSRRTRLKEIKKTLRSLPSEQGGDIPQAVRDLFAP